MASLGRISYVDGKARREDESMQKEMRSTSFPVNMHGHVRRFLLSMAANGRQIRKSESKLYDMHRSWAFIDIYNRNGIRGRCVEE